MEDPVILRKGRLQLLTRLKVFAADGFSYEHSAIVKWLKTSNLSPVRSPHESPVGA